MPEQAGPDDSLRSQPLAIRVPDGAVPAAEVGVIRILHGDCLDVLRTLPAESVHAVVTDPPYGLTSARPTGRSVATKGAVMKGFMGLAWDGDVPSVEVWAECLRVLKPGGTYWLSPAPELNTAWPCASRTPGSRFGT